MQKIRFILTMRKSFLCVFQHPQVIVPFLVFSLITSLIFVYAFDRMIEFIGSFDVFTSPEEMPFEAFGSFFSFFYLIMLVALFAFFAFPFFESWTFAALGYAFKSEPVSLSKAAKKGLSKYLGVLVISIIISLVSAVVGSIVSIVVLLAFSPFMTSTIPVSLEYVAPSLAQLSGYFIMYGVIVLFITLFMVFFIYLKPSYVLGDRRFSESLNDGFETVRKNIVPSWAFYLSFEVMRMVSLGVIAGIVIWSGMIDVEEFVVLEDFQIISTFLSELVPFVVVAIVVNYLIYTLQYTAIAYAYLDSHEMIAREIG
ncbi:MAG: hypothetical protein HXS44_12640 [Theionarchaea archaeon]|nr:hypothetical protein [Theionarchaea archaeon]